MGFERVYTMTDYYDGPRGGIADFEGRPHVYESEWDVAADDYANTFRLSPSELDVVALALEDRAICERWWMAFYSGRATEDTRPALPPDRARHVELERILGERVRIDPRNFVRATAEFRRAADWNGEGLATSEVQWRRVPDGQ